MNAEVKG